jgi:hypothetical protein
MHRKTTEEAHFHENLFEMDVAVVNSHLMKTEKMEVIFHESLYATGAALVDSLYQETWGSLSQSLQLMVQKPKMACRLKEVWIPGV